jgi:hypothetical protein
MKRCWLVVTFSFPGRLSQSALRLHDLNSCAMIDVGLDLFGLSLEPEMSCHWMMWRG